VPSLPPCDLTRRCPKCGSDDINTRWVKAAPFASSKILVSDRMRERYLQDHPAIEEHVARTCRTCQYAWPEAPLDQCSAVDQLAAKADA